MSKLILQTDTFSEDELVDTQAIIKKYFDIEILSDEEAIGFLTERLDAMHLRVSIAAAQYLYKLDFSWTNALEWLPALREFYLTPEYYFIDLGRHLKAPANSVSFVRPASGKKEFSGNVYTMEQIQKEADFMKQNKNIDDTLICLVAKPVVIRAEYRCVFVAGKLVSMCQYMKFGEKFLSKDAPSEVAMRAMQIAEHPFFINKFDFVLDLGVDNNSEQVRLIEINRFETSSFYMCDLDKIYKAYSEAF